MSTNTSLQTHLQRNKWRMLKRQVANSWQLYFFVLPGLIYYAVFHYLPLYGIQIAFKDYKAIQGVMGSSWVGLKHFDTFFKSYLSWPLVRNTLLVNFYALIFGFPVPVILSLLLNRVSMPKFKKFSQTVIYIPHFISTVVLAGMLYIFLEPTNGFVNKIVSVLGGNPQFFMAESAWFRRIFVISAIWQNSGWNTIVYIAALTSIDQEMYEAATLDGASIIKQIWYIDIPSIIPMAMMMLILNSGQIMAGNMQKTLLLQTAGNKGTSNTIGVYVYQIGLQSGQFSYTAAIGLFQNIISFLMVSTVNYISKRFSSISMF
ncbi:MAG: ABC transporter permease [Christensenellales bacterium]